MKENFRKMGLLLNTIKRKNLDETPIWLMRQAGRYLPEYRKIRNKVGSFLELCNNPDLSTEITMQPLNRFDLDAAIIFSDILTIPQALGAKVSFIENHGPLLNYDFNEVKEEDFSNRLDINYLSSTYNTIKQVRSILPKEKELIGFAGAPWTLAAYMLEGKSSKDFHKIRKTAYEEPEHLDLLIQKLERGVLLHLKNQIAAGVNIVQLFDSHAGFAEYDLFERYCINPAERIVKELKYFSPNTPIICFPRGAGEKYLDFVIKVDTDVISIDYTVDSLWASNHLNKHCVVQGNLDPVKLEVGGKNMEISVKKILKSFSKSPHIFNLGHGVLPTTPIQNVEELIKLVKAK